MATTWSLSFQKVEQANPAAAELLRLCAFLAPDNIPEELIRDGAAQWSSLLRQAAADLFTFNEMMADLLKFSLVKRLADTKTFSIHRLVQAVQMDMMEPEVQCQWAERVVQAVDRVFPEHPEDITAWPQCLRYLDQAQACYMLIEKYGLALVEAADLLDRTGYYLNEHALYTIAGPLYQRALAINEQQLGSEHPNTANSLNNLASLYRHQGRYIDAEPLYRRALAINEQQLEPEHPDTAATIDNLVFLYWKQRRYTDAEPLYQRALAIREQQLGPEHPDTAATLNNLALLYRKQRRYTDAEPLYQRALAICEQQLGSEHLSTATTLTNLAGLYRHQEKYEIAEPLYQRALHIFVQKLGQNHPHTKTIRKIYAILLRAMGRNEEVKKLGEDS